MYERFEAIKQRMERKKIDLLLISHTPNARYFLDMYMTEFSGLLCIPKKQEPFILTSPFSKTSLEKAGIETIAVSPNIKADMKAKNYLAAFRALAKKRNIRGRTAIEKQFLAADIFEKYKKVFKLADFSKEIAEQRAIKSNHEIKRIEEACKITVKGMHAVVHNMQQGVSERELAAAFEAEVRKKADWFSFETIVASGKHSAEPHYVPSDKKINKNDFVIIDCGVIKNNYCSDMTRTFCIEPNEKQKQLYEIVLKAQQKAIEKIKFGARAAYIDKQARDFIKSRGFPDFFLHGLGHGIGVEVHEQPMINPKSNNVLKPGMVFSIEPGIYIKDFGGVRIEDAVLLTRKGIKILTEFPKTLEVRK